MRFQANKRSVPFFRAFSQQRVDGDYTYWRVTGVSKMNSERYCRASKRFTRTPDFKKESLIAELRQLSCYSSSLVGATIVRRARKKNQVV